MFLFNYVRDCLQNLLLISSKFKQINELLFILKSFEILWFSNDFWGLILCLILKAKFGDDSLNVITIWEKIESKGLYAIQINDSPCC